jgi:outer membrane protein assembly factor BamA
VERRLKNFGTFRNVYLKEEVQNNQVDLLVHLEDLWTIFPVPIASTGSGSSFGIGVFDRNFLGFQKTAGVLALLKEKKPRVFMVYNDPHFVAWNWELTLLGGYSEERVFDYDQESISTGIFLRYRFSDFLSFGGGYRFAKNTHSGSLVIPEDGNTHSLSIDLLYNRLYLDEDYIKGQSFGISLTKELWFSDLDFSRVILDVSFYRKALRNHTFALQNQLSLSWKAPYGYRFVLGGKGGWGTLPVKGYDDNEFIPSQLLSGLVEYRIPFYTSRGFTFSSVAFYDYAFFSDEIKGLFNSEFIHSFGISLRIYLRNLALPALQLYAAYLPERDLMSIGLMVGMFSRQN